MRENYFVKLIKYINNAYHIDKQIEHISDKRVNPTYKTAQIISSKGEILKIDVIKNSLKSVGLNGLRKIN